MSESYAHLLALTHRLLASFGAQALAPFLLDWPAREAACQAPSSAGAASALPVLRWLPHIAVDAHSVDPDLLAARPDAARSGCAGPPP